jgi:prephenate dehydrogenase
MKSNDQPPFSRITIVGVGLIGGSLGLALKRRYGSQVFITGSDRPGVLGRAKSRGAIDRVSDSLPRAVNKAELVILAAPPKVIVELLPRIARLVTSDVIVTDVGSVKREIVDEARRVFPRNNFIGGHPMAGVENSGIEAAHPLLFENAVYVLTPLPRTPQEKLQRLIRLFSDLGARVVLLDARTHDAVASAVSHLPQLAAVALMNVAGRLHPTSSQHLSLAAGGFRDLTRIASSSFEIWQHILPMNAAEIRRSLSLFVEELQSYGRQLERRGLGSLPKKFAEARELRNQIPKSMKGFVAPLAELYVFVEDKPGMLARLTTALHEAKINIKDIELMKIREGTGGTFRVSFESEELANQAEGVLRRVGFEVER